MDKNGGDIVYSGAGRPAAESGNRILFSALTEFAGSEYGGGAADTHYIATRDGGGWTTKPTSPAVTPSASGSDVRNSTPDLGLTLLSSPGLFDTDPMGGDKDLNLYLRDNATGDVKPWFGVSSLTTSYLFVGATISRQGDHLAFGTAEALTSDPVPDETFLKVYERTAAGLRLVSVDSGGAPFQHAGVGSTGEVLINQFSTRGAISDDGRHIFFNAAAGPSSPRELYRRTDGTTTVPVSPTKRAVPDPEGVKTKIFRIATGNGRRVLFTSAEHLTDDANTGPSRAGNDLYRYDVEGDELIDISATSDGGDGARVQGVVAATPSGDRVYYTALGQVVPGEGSASGTEPNLYLWEDDGTADGNTRFVATMSSADQLSWIFLSSSWRARMNSGGDLLFETAVPIPGHDNGGVQQVYRYDPDADSLDCVSCNPDGDAPLGDASLPVGGSELWEHPRAISDDGRRVFFNTEDALVDHDSNGEIDPYVWQDGELTLLSTGTSPRPSYFYNASLSGDDAFIVTAEALVPQDVDDLYDLYDARVGGGFAPPERADCEPASCQPNGAGLPAPGAAGSVSLLGAGDVASLPRQTLSVKRLSRAQLSKLAIGRTIGIRVRVARAGKVRVVVRRRSGRKVAAGTARAKRAGRVVVPLRLSKAARRRLQAGAVMRLSLTASAVGARPQSLSVRLRGIL